MEQGLECLQAGGKTPCKGAVEYRMPLSGTGVPYPRCDRHWSERLAEQDRIDRAYAPDSDCPPAGVSWSEWSEDY